MKPHRLESIAMIVFGLLGGGAVLIGPPVPSESAACQVFVVITDAQGKPEPGLKPRLRPCRPGETDGGVEYYNPYANTYRFSDIPLEPLAGSGGSTGSGGTGRTGSGGTTGAGSATPKGPKSSHTTTQTPSSGQ